MHIHANPMAGVVRKKSFVGLLLFDFIARALEEFDLPQSVDQNIQSRFVNRRQVAARQCNGNGRFLCRQDDFVKGFLFGRKLASDRESPRDIGGVIITLGTGIHEQKIAVAEFHVVTAVMKDAGICSTGNDRPVGFHFCAVSQEFPKYQSVDIPFGLARANRFVDFFESGSRDCRRRTHAVHFLAGLVQAHFSGNSPGIQYRQLPSACASNQALVASNGSDNLFVVVRAHPEMVIKGFSLTQQLWQHRPQLVDPVGLVDSDA